jgi:hypothetical protein
MLTTTPKIDPAVCAKLEELGVDNVRVLFLKELPTANPATDPNRMIQFRNGSFKIVDVEGWLIKKDKQLGEEGRQLGEEARQLREGGRKQLFWARFGVVIGIAIFIVAAVAAVFSYLSLPPPPSH